MPTTCSVWALWSGPCRRGTGASADGEVRLGGGDRHIRAGMRPYQRPNERAGVRRLPAFSRASSPACPSLKSQAGALLTACGRLSGEREVQYLSGQHVKLVAKTFASPLIRGHDGGELTANLAVNGSGRKPGRQLRVAAADA